MTTATFQSVEEILEDVRAMRPKGGSAFGGRAALAFKLVASDASIGTVDHLFSRLDEVAAALLAEKPTMATIHNARALIVEKSRQQVNRAELAGLKAAVIQRADRFMQQSGQALQQLGQVGANLIEAGQTIMMHSFSRSLMSVFEQAQRAGKSFAVICTESRPTHESRWAIEQLTGQGIPVTFGLDAAMAVLISEADWCLAGADSVGIDGSVANKIGTYQLALLAHHFGKPFYVATEVIKLQRQTQAGHPIHLEQRPARELLEVETVTQTPQRVTVRHPFFDLTPPAYIRALITEQGLLSPGAIGPAWDRLEASFGAEHGAAKG